MAIHVIIFDASVDVSRQVEGIGVAYAVTTGACNTCPERLKCESDPNFVFPQGVACTNFVQKAMETAVNESLKEMDN